MIASAGYEGLPWLGLMVVLVIVLVAALGAVVLYFRKRAVGKLPDDASVMSIEQLEQLRTDGVITEEEFRRLRRVVIGLPEKSPAAPNPPQAAADAPPAKNEGGSDATPAPDENSQPADDPPPGDEV